MTDINSKELEETDREVDKVLEMIQEGKYFCLNRARFYPYPYPTLLDHVSNRVSNDMKEEFLTMFISFEGSAEFYPKIWKDFVVI